MGDRLGAGVTVLPEPDDPGCMDIWVPSLGLYTQQFAAERARHGQSAWAYIVDTSEGSFAVRRGMAHYRSLFWNIWRRRCAGFLYFCTTFYEWAPSPADFNRDGSPKKTFLPEGSIGIHHLCYPAGARPEDGLHASVRLEAIRDGLEDWEYLHMLRNLIRDKAPSAEAKAAARLLHEIDSGALSAGVPPDERDRIAARSPLLEQRRRVAETIEVLTAGE